MDAFGETVELTDEFLGANPGTDFRIAVKSWAGSRP